MITVMFTQVEVQIRFNKRTGVGADDKRRIPQDFSTTTISMRGVFTTVTNGHSAFIDDVTWLVLDDSFRNYLIEMFQHVIPKLWQFCKLDTRKLWQKLAKLPHDIWK